MMAPGTTARLCCSDRSCPYRDTALELHPDDPIEDRIHLVAIEVAGTCTTLGPADLASCFVKLFDIPAECQLFERFRAVYQAECDALHEGRYLRKQ